MRRAELCPIAAKKLGHINIYKKTLSTSNKRVNLCVLQTERVSVHECGRRGDSVKTNKNTVQSYGQARNNNSRDKTDLRQTSEK